MPKALAWLARAPVRKTDGQWSLLYWPSVAPLRRDPLFFSKMARIGLVDFWRRYDRWPDFCREPGLRYDCKGETERLVRSEEHTSELQSLMRISYAVFCLKKKTNQHKNTYNAQLTHNR